MRMTVGKKLGLGFGIMIFLIGISTIAAHRKLTHLDRSVEVAVDQSFPIQLAGRSLIGDVNASLAALRGHLLLGGDPKVGETFKALRAKAWLDMDMHLSDLKLHRENWERGGEDQRFYEFGVTLEEFRTAQQAVEDIAHTEDNNQPLRHMESELLPLMRGMTASLDALLSEEAELEATPERKEMLHALGTLQQVSVSAVSELRFFLVRGDEESRRQSEELPQEFEALRSRIESRKNLLTASQGAHWQEYIERYNAFKPMIGRLIAMRTGPEWDQANYRLTQEAIPRARRLIELLVSIDQSLGQTVSGHRQSISVNAQAVTHTLIGGTVLAMVIGTLVAIGLSRRMVAGIQAVAGGARRVADGDLTGNEIEVRSKDEVGELAVAFNGMQAGLKEMAGQIRQATENVNSTAAEMLAAIQQQAAASNEQSATVQEVTATLEEINQSGNQIGDRAKQVSAAVEESSGATARGIEATRETTETMRSIRDQVEEVAENIVNVSERTQTIGEIIVTVSEIAEQSNLLALNASIEAISAGDQGGRFSVVAHEMKNLADRAKDCTVQVRTILGEIQKGINTSVMMTEEAVKRVEVGKQKATSTETTIRNVTEINDGSIQAFQQIIAGTSQQQIGVSQVTQGMLDIRQTIEQTAASTSQMEKSAANMNALSQQLKSAVAQYRI